MFGKKFFQKFWCVHFFSQCNFNVKRRRGHEILLMLKLGRSQQFWKSDTTPSRLIYSISQCQEQCVGLPFNWALNYSDNLQIILSRTRPATQQFRPGIGILCRADVKKGVCVWDKHSTTILVASVNNLNIKSLNILTSFLFDLRLIAPRP